MKYAVVSTFDLMVTKFVWLNINTKFDHKYVLPTAWPCARHFTTNKLNNTGVNSQDTYGRK